MKQPKLPEPNIELLRQTRARILKEPGENLNMNIWICDTAHCIGGMAVLVHDGDKVRKKYAKLHREGEYEPIENRARKVLGLTNDEGDHLFVITRWPWEFERDYERAETQTIKKRVAAKRITAFIKWVINKRKETSDVNI